MWRTADPSRHGAAHGSADWRAKAVAGVVLLGNDLAKFVQTLWLAWRTRRIIWAHFTGTIVVDVLGIALAAAGLLSSLLAAFIQVASELICILDSARRCRRPSAK